MKKLFYPGGIRCKAGSFPLDSCSIKKIARSIAILANQEEHFFINKKIVIATDTRSSGREIYESLLAGFRDSGMFFEVYDLGVMPTNAAAMYSKNISASLCIVITASHNHFSENGLKFFDHQAKLISQDLESKLEDIFFNQKNFDTIKNQAQVDVQDRSLDAKEFYVNFLREEIFQDISEKRIVIDFANGSFSSLSGEIKKLFGNVIPLHNIPNGKNINLNCGSLYPNETIKKVKESKVDLGFAVDGDGDRIVLIDEEGEVIPSDKLMAFLALEKKKDDSHKRKIVVTHYSNLALDKFLHNHDIAVVRTENGERNVVSEMYEDKISMGGEYSGHIIFRNLSFAGDGFLVALQTLCYLKKNNLKPSYINHLFDMYPSVLVNVCVKEKVPFEDVEVVSQEIEKVKFILKDKGRLFLRYSDTESMCRIFIEGEDKVQIKDLANHLAVIIKRELS